MATISSATLQHHGQQSVQMCWLTAPLEILDTACLNTFWLFQLTINVLLSTDQSDKIQPSVYGFKGFQDISWQRP